MPMTCKAVLNEICLVLNVKCFVSWHVNNAYDNPAIYFVDFKEFKFSTQTPVFHYKYNCVFAGMLDETISNFFNTHVLDNQDLQYYDKPKLAIKPGFSQVDLTYNGYAYDQYFSNSDWGDQKNWVNKNFTWVDVNYTDDNSETQLLYKYTSGWTGIVNWYANNWAELIGYNESNTSNDDADFCCHWVHDALKNLGDGDELVKLYSFCPVYDPQIFMYGIDNQYIKITAQAKFINRPLVYNFPDPDDIVPISVAAIKAQINVGSINNAGGSYYDELTNVWNSSTGNTIYLKHAEDKTANFENSWVEISCYVPINHNINGEIRLKFFDHVIVGYVPDSYSPTDVWNMSQITLNDLLVIESANNTKTNIIAPCGYDLNHVLLKDVKAVAVTTKNDTVASSDIKTIGYFDQNYKSKFSVSMKIGDSSNNSMQQRGALLTTDNPNKLATNFYRGTQSDRYNLNNLLVKLLAAESQDPRTTLQAKISSDEIFCNGSSPFNQLSIMTCPHLTGKVFMLESGEYNARMKTLEANFCEVLNEDSINY